MYYNKVALFSVMYEQGAIPPLPQRPEGTHGSHQSSINTGRITFDLPNTPPITFYLEPSDLQRLHNDAAAMDLSNLLQTMGTLDSSQMTNQTTFKHPSDLLPASCRLQQAMSEQQGRSSSSNLAPLPSFT